MTDHVLLHIKHQLKVGYSQTQIICLPSAFHLTVACLHVWLLEAFLN